jgi:hypothetical protein
MMQFKREVVPMGTIKKQCVAADLKEPSFEKACATLRKVPRGPSSLSLQVHGPIQ